MKYLIQAYAIICVIIGWIIGFITYPLYSILTMIVGTWHDIDDFLEKKLKK